MVSIQSDILFLSRRQAPAYQEVNLRGMGRPVEAKKCLALEIALVYDLVKLGIVGVSYVWQCTNID